LREGSILPDDLLYSHIFYCSFLRLIFETELRILFHSWQRGRLCLTGRAIASI
jgi:hypothetical protein